MELRPLGGPGLKAAGKARICRRDRWYSESSGMANPFQFVQQVRSEVSKVVWPTRREVVLTTTMVAIMASLVAIFFFLIDQIIKLGLEAILGVAS
jgi:preprotein translocase subunit SecE